MGQSAGVLQGPCCCGTRDLALGPPALVCPWPSRWRTLLADLACLGRKAWVGWAAGADVNHAAPAATSFSLKFMKRTLCSAGPMKTSHFNLNYPRSSPNRSSNGSRIWRSFTWICSGCAATWPACKAGSCPTPRASSPPPAAPPSWPSAGWASCLSPLSTLWWAPREGHAGGFRGRWWRPAFSHLVLRLDPVTAQGPPRAGHCGDGGWEASCCQECWLLCCFLLGAQPLIDRDSVFTSAPTCLLYFVLSGR